MAFDYASFTVIIVILITVIVVMSVVWYYTRKLDKMEIERLVAERDRLQKERGCAIQSSEEVQS